MTGTVALAALAVWAAWPSWQSLIWRTVHDEQAGHVMLVPVVGAWLFWTRRSRIVRLAPRGLWVGPLTAAVAVAALAAGTRWDLEAVSYLGAGLLLAAAVLSCTGTGLLRNYAPVFAVIAFLAPLPGRWRPLVAEPVEQLTVGIVKGILALVGTPVGHTGDVLIVGEQRVPISEAFSGLQMVFALILVTYAFAFSTPLRNYVRFTLLVASPMLAVAGNALRLAPTLWMHGHSSRSAALLFQDVGGWVMLFGALLLLIGMLRLMEWMELPVTRLSRVGR